MQLITVPELAEQQSRGETAQLLDVRTPHEYAQGHLPGAVNLPLDALAARADDISPRLPVVLICQKGGRATQAYGTLAETHRSLFVSEGGTDAWVRAGKPLVGKTTRTNWSIERQVRFIAGLIVFLSTSASFVWRPAVGIALFLGAALTITALVNWCGMAILLSKMPWNRIATPTIPPQPKTEGATR